MSLATSRGGHAHNEDFAGAVHGGAVLLDGAGIPGAEAICSHGVAWYTHRLGGALLGRLSRGAGDGLAGILATVIEEIAADHRGTCDLADPTSPQATVAMVRTHGDRLDYLLLADCFLLLDHGGGRWQVITDGREAACQSTCAAPLVGLPAGTPEYDRVRASCVAALRALRNQPGGYWIAKDDPRAAAEAVTGSLSLAGIDSVALLSNGASRLVSPYGVTDWPGVLAVLAADGPDEVVRRVREAEAGLGADAPAADDATVLYWSAVNAGFPAGTGGAVEHRAAQPLSLRPRRLPPGLSGGERHGARR